MLAHKLLTADCVSPPSTSCNQCTSAEQARWFTEEVHTHDSALKCYLRASFPTIRDVDDIAQESYVRIWKQRAADPIRSVKAFLFTIAQHLALDVLRRERRSPLLHVEHLDRLPVQDAAPAGHEMWSEEERLRLLIDALDALPARCRAVVILRKLKLLSQRETALALGISEKGVENQLARGLDRCRAFMRHHPSQPPSGHGF